MSEVLILVVPSTTSGPSHVSVSAAASPNTASPLTVRPCGPDTFTTPPTTVPLVVIVVPVSVVEAPSRTESL